MVGIGVVQAETSGLLSFDTGHTVAKVRTALRDGNSFVVASKYSFNDMWKDPKRNKIILASSQSGGSCVHVLDLAHSNWKRAYTNLSPPGKIEAVLANTNAVRDHLQTYVRPARERDPLPVYLLSESVPDSVKGLVNTIKASYDSPVFLENAHMPKVEDWDRSSIQNEKYRNKRDQRNNTYFPAMRSWIFLCQRIVTIGVSLSGEDTAMTPICTA